MYTFCHEFLRKAFSHLSGGYDRGECLNLVEVYNVDTNTWTSLPSMKHNRGRFDITCVDNNIVYAVAGSNGHAEISSVEKYDAAAGKWCKVASLPVSLSNIGKTIHSAVTLNRVRPSPLTTLPLRFLLILTTALCETCVRARRVKAAAAASVRRRRRRRPEVAPARSSSSKKLGSEYQPDAKDTQVCTIYVVKHLRTLESLSPIQLK